MGVDLGSGRSLLVGGMLVCEGVVDGVLNIANVEVKDGKMDIFVDVFVIVEEIVGVVKSLAKASIVSALSVLLVGVAVSPPVFGMMRSGSCRFCEVTRVEINGMLNAIPAVARMSIKTRFSFFAFTPLFLSCLMHETPARWFVIPSAWFLEIISQFCKTFTNS